jgi:hypothetical protein
MKSINAKLILSVGLLLICTSAQARFNTSELLSICKSGLQNQIKEDPKFSFCTGAMLGMLMTDSLEKDLICVPNDLDTKAGLRLFIQRAEREPHKDIEGFVTMYRAFLEAYPCKKK